MHTGEAEQRDGDYFGPALNRAARLMSVAYAGQVLCTQATADLVRTDSRRSSISSTSDVTGFATPQIPAAPNSTGAALRVPMSREATNEERAVRRRRVYLGGKWTTNGA